MGQKQRNRPGATPFYVVEMNFKVFDAGQELWIPVQAGFHLAPVKSRSPIVGEGLHVIPVGAIAPVARVIRGVQPVRPAVLLDAAQNAFDDWPLNFYAELTEAARCGCWNGLGQQRQTCGYGERSQHPAARHFSGKVVGHNANSVPEGANDFRVSAGK
jgi:hypothetical protein